MNFASVNNGWHQRGKNQAKIVFKRKTFFMGTFELLYMGVMLRFHFELISLAGVPYAVLLPVVTTCLISLYVFDCELIVTGMIHYSYTVIHHGD